VLYLKQSTAATVKIGPFLDNGDGYTAETGLTISQADVRLSKNGGNMAQKNSSTACTHDELGYYDCPLSTTDTNTLGRLQLMVAESGALPVFHDYTVVTANVYDTLCGSDRFDVEVYTKTGFQLLNDTVGTVTTLTNKQGFELSSAGVAAFLSKPVTGYAVGTLGYTLELIRKIQTNKWAISGTTFTIYDDNGTSALKQFTLDDPDEPMSRTPV
jgi:hypothetical protein